MHNADDDNRFDAEMRHWLRRLPVPEPPQRNALDARITRRQFFRRQAWLALGAGAAAAGITAAAWKEIVEVSVPALVRAAFAHVEGERSLRGMLLHDMPVAQAALGFDPQSLAGAVLQLAKDCHVAAKAVWHWSYFLERNADAGLGWAWLLVFREPLHASGEGHFWNRHWAFLRTPPGHTALLLAHTHGTYRNLYTKLLERGFHRL